MKIHLSFILSAFCALPVPPALAWYQPPPVAVPQGFLVDPRGHIWQNYGYVQPQPQPYAGGAVQQGVDPDQYNASHRLIERYGCYNLNAC